MSNATFSSTMSSPVGRLTLVGQGDDLVGLYFDKDPLAAKMRADSTRDDRPTARRRSSSSRSTLPAPARRSISRSYRPEPRFKGRSGARC